MNLDFRCLSRAGSPRWAAVPTGPPLWCLVAAVASSDTLTFRLPTKPAPLILMFVPHAMPSLGAGKMPVPVLSCAHPPAEVHVLSLERLS